MHGRRAQSSGWAWRGMVGGFALVPEARGPDACDRGAVGQGRAAGRQAGRGIRRQRTRTRERTSGALAGGGVEPNVLTRDARLCERRRRVCGETHRMT